MSLYYYIKTDFLIKELNKTETIVITKDSSKLDYRLLLNNYCAAGARRRESGSLDRRIVPGLEGV